MICQHTQPSSGPTSYAARMARTDACLTVVASFPLLRNSKVGRGRAPCLRRKRRGRQASRSVRIDALARLRRGGRSLHKHPNGVESVPYKTNADGDQGHPHMKHSRHLDEQNHEEELGQHGTHDLFRFHHEICLCRFHGFFRIWSTGSMICFAWCSGIRKGESFQDETPGWSFLFFSSLEKSDTACSSIPFSVTL